MSLIKSVPETGSRYNRNTMAITQKYICMLLLLSCFVGCGERIITIQSEPNGALVWLNGREVGRTPVQVNYVYDGNYDVRIERDGYEPIMTTKNTTSYSSNEWVFTLTARDDNPELLFERAKLLQGMTDGEQGE
jgi:hypothetical protein